MTAYPIGHQVWHRGDQVTITGEPYTLHGGQWQDGVTEAGKPVTLTTPAAKQAQQARQKADWQADQASFRRLAELEKQS